MKGAAIRYREMAFSYPLKTAPEWADLVERWYQLDAPAAGLCAAYWSWKADLPSPSLILLASPAASNETDWHFVQSGTASPQKFVHTLPNARGSSLNQLMQWGGPLLCLQKERALLAHTLGEASLFLSAYPILWCLGVRKETALLDPNRGSYLAYLFEMENGDGSLFPYRLSRSSEKGEESVADEALLDWFRSQSESPLQLWDRQILLKETNG